MSQLSELLAECRKLGIGLVADGDNLAVEGPAERVTPDLLERMKAHKAELLAYLSIQDYHDPPGGDDSDPWTTAIEPPDPCPQCNSLELWQSMAGNWKCQQCEPPTRSLRWMKQAEKLRSGSP